MTIVKALGFERELDEEISGIKLESIDVPIPRAQYQNRRSTSATAEAIASGIQSPDR